MKHFSLISMLATALFLLPNIAVSGTVTYLYSSNCITDCANVGLSDGDSVGGSVVIDDTNIAPNAFIGLSDVISFSFNIGTLSISNINAPYVLFTSLLSADPDQFDFFALIASTAFFPNTGEYIHIAESDGRGSLDGYCKTTSCNISNKGQNSAQFGEGKLSVVPLPAAGWLFGIGLAGLIYLRQRKTT